MQHITRLWLAGLIWLWLQQRQCNLQAEQGPVLLLVFWKIVAKVLNQSELVFFGVVEKPDRARFNCRLDFDLPMRVKTSVNKFDVRQFDFSTEKDSFQRDVSILQCD